MAFQPMTPPNPTATLPWYERMNPFGDFVPAAEKSARAQGLLQLGLGILANNQGNYGALGPALARGGMQGLQAYQGALMQQSQKRRNQLQDRLLGAQINETTAQAQERQAKMDATKNREQQWGTLLEEMNSIAPPPQPSTVSGAGSVGADGALVAPTIGVSGAKPWEQDPKMLRYAASRALAFDQDKANNLMQRAEALEKMNSPVPKTLPGTPYYSYGPNNELVFNQDVYNKELELARAKGQNFNFGQPIAVDAGDGTQRLVQVSPQGQVKELGLKPGGAVKTTDGERIGKGYHDRMVAAEAILRGIGKPGFPNEATAAGSSIPLVGAYVERRAMTTEQQQYRQAQEDWVRAKLRKESGAVIGAKEMSDEIRTYFPQPGDLPQVIAQKQASREIAIQAMRDAAGAAIPGNTSTRGTFQEQSTFGGGELPKGARMNLQEGKVTTFKNGQSWTLRGGQPVRVK
jgi:hypothetical protein